MSEPTPQLSIITTLDPRPGIMAAFYHDFSCFSAKSPLLVELVIVNGLKQLLDTQHLYPPQEDKTVRLTTSPHADQGSAFLHGASLARGKILISIDPDMPKNIKDIPALLKRHDEGAQLVFTRRIRRNDASLLRRQASYLFNFLLRIITGENIGDFNSPMFLIERSAFNKLLSLKLSVEEYKFHAYYLNRENFSQMDIEVSGTQKYKSNYDFRTLLRLFFARLGLALKYRKFIKY